MVSLARIFLKKHSGEMKEVGTASYFHENALIGSIIKIFKLCPF
jgi:hypothetical protein